MQMCRNLILVRLLLMSAFISRCLAMVYKDLDNNCAITSNSAIDGINRQFGSIIEREQ